MIEIAKTILSEHILCDNCLGRQFALLGYGLSNQERGKIIKEALLLENYNAIPDDTIALAIIENIALMNNELAQKTLQRKKIHLEYSERECEICGDLFSRIDNIVDEILNKLQKEEFDSFLVGAVVSPILEEKDDQIKATYKISTSESIKEEFTREIGKRIYLKTKKETKFDLPDITIIIDLQKQKIVLEKRSLYIYGRYRKFVRNIPQTRWPCWECRGKGCEKCHYTGKLYQESVEELIANPIIKITGGSGTKFHGAGREDIDALMLGNGRPFVLEIKNPDKREINLQKITKIVNKKTKSKVAVDNLEITDKRKIQELKGSSTETRKTYRAKIKVDKEITPEASQKIEEILKGVIIKQYTPQRVLHRRSNLERLRSIYDIKVKFIDKFELEAEITGEGGLYIKELISGDDGRTKPSFASILSCNAKCYQLDVIKVHSKAK
ncbi:MAG: tRNA pseudouridine(54/55) synthase Pus10 [Candidatus Thorarchaeota archaeon]